MKLWKLLPIVLVVLLVAGSSQAEEKSSKQSYKERIKAMEDAFFAASQAGKTVKGIIVEGNSLFNGTTAPQNKPYGQPYTEKELLAAKISAERNSQLFILAEDGTLYYPTPKKGESISQSSNSPRIPRTLTEEQKERTKAFYLGNSGTHGRKGNRNAWRGLPGILRSKGYLYIKSIQFEGEYIVEE